MTPHMYSVPSTRHVCLRPMRSPLLFDLQTRSIGANTHTAPQRVIVTARYYLASKRHRFGNMRTAHACHHDRRRG